uniref:Uncharacterized protein n=1 Tax=Gopherus evgoodei TaxID=1825980 RepID=A0A8C4VJ37_9SAUR
MSDNEDNFDGDDFDDVEEDEGLDDLENAEEEGQENVEILPSGERLLMTKYEQARVLGAETPLLAAKQMAAFPSLYSSACSTPGDYPDWNKQYLRQLCSLEGYTF